MGVLGTKTGAARCSAPISEVLLSFEAGVAFVKAGLKDRGYERQ